MLPAPAPASDDPLGLLRACHQRMLDFCDLLDRIPGHLAAHGIDDALQVSGARVLRYFDSAAPLHHQDEETDLFPMLVGQPGLSALFDRLAAEHQTHERLWQQLAGHLRAFEQHQVGPDLAQRIDAFTGAVRGHVHIENSQVLPVAAQRLTAGQLQRLGDAMLRRRRPTDRTDPA